MRCQCKRGLVSRLSGGARFVVAVVVTAALVVGCVGSSRPSRAEVLSTLASEVIVPGYENAQTSLVTLVSAVRQLCASPDAQGVTEARQALARARRSWKNTEAFWVGPVMDRRSWALVDWPVNAGEVYRLIDDESAPDLDAAYIARFVGADQRGLGTVELLLGGESQGLVGRTCDYLQSAAEVAASEVAEVLLVWQQSETVSDFTDAGVDELVNEAVFLTRRMSDTELGAAMGAMGREADLQKIVEGPQGLGVADGIARLEGLRAVFAGADGSDGLAALLGDELAVRLDNDFVAAREAWRAVTGPLRDAVGAQPERVAAARSAVKNLERTIATEVVSQLGVAIGFSDLDGDSGG